MPETKTAKAKTIFSISKEVNRQSTEVLEYLKRIGIDAQGIMSKVDESVYRKILGHFKSDIEEAEKHKQKLLEFQKKHKSIEFTEIEEELKVEKEKKIVEEEERKRKHDEEEKRKKELSEIQKEQETKEKEKDQGTKKKEKEKDIQEKEVSKSTPQAAKGKGAWKSKIFRRKSM